MKKSKICKIIDYYERCNMNDLEYKKELIYQKHLCNTYESEANILFLLLIALISISTALYVSEYQEMDVYISCIIIIMGIFFGIAYLLIREKQSVAFLRMIILIELECSIRKDINSKIAYEAEDSFYIDNSARIKSYVVTINEKN